MKSKDPVYPLDPTLGHLIDNRPSIFFNSALNIPLQIIFYIPGAIFFSVGLGLVADGLLQSNFLSDYVGDKIYEILELPTQGREALSELLLGLGVFLTTFGLLFLLIARLTRMILKRNAFILELVIRREELRELEGDEESGDGG